MAKRVSKRHSKRHSRTQKGGDLAGNPASAWGWTLGTVGDGMTQIMNSLTLQPGQNAATAQSNNLVPIGNINASNPSEMLNLKMGGGAKRRRKHGSKCKRSKCKRSRGGSWGAVLAQGAVPLTLLGAQQMFGRRKTKKH
jgi:hypothetical protein